MSTGRLSQPQSQQRFNRRCVTRIFDQRIQRADLIICRIARTTIETERRGREIRYPTTESDRPSALGLT